MSGVRTGLVIPKIRWGRRVNRERLEAPEPTATARNPRPRRAGVGHCAGFPAAPQGPTPRALLQDEEVGGKIRHVGGAGQALATKAVPGDQPILLGTILQINCRDTRRDLRHADLYLCMMDPGRAGDVIRELPKRQNHLDGVA